MMQKFQKMLDKKSKSEKPLDEMEKNAKMSVIDEMRKMADGQMGGKLDGLKKVTVAADSKPELAKGLDTAKHMVDPDADQDDDSDMEDLEEQTGEDLDHDNEADESPEHQEAVLGHHEMPTSPDEIDQKIQELLALKEKMSR